MRGAHVVAADLYDRRRIIPADAGSTGLGYLLTKHARDHPRGCGEHRALTGHRQC